MFFILINCWSLSFWYLNWRAEWPSSNWAIPDKVYTGGGECWGYSYMDMLIWGSFWLFCGHLNCCYILINYFLLTYKVEINYAPIINRINYLSENILCLKNDKTVTEIYLKSLRTKHLSDFIISLFQKDSEFPKFSLQYCILRYQLTTEKSFLSLSKTKKIKNNKQPRQVFLNN